MIEYISNPALSDTQNCGYVSLEKNFVYCFETGESDIFDLYFGVKDGTINESQEDSFTISNTNIAPYTQNIVNGKVVVSLKVGTTKSEIQFMEHTLKILKYVKEDKEYPYLKVDGSINVSETDDYIIQNGITYILPKQSERIYTLSGSGSSRKVQRIFDNKVILVSSGTDITHYYNENNIFDSTIPKKWKIVVSANGTTITVLTKNFINGAYEPNYIKRKTFLFNKTKEKGYIRFKISKNVKLSEASFSFFKADVS